MWWSFRRSTVTKIRCVAPACCIATFVIDISQTTVDYSDPKKSVRGLRLSNEHALTLHAETSFENQSSLGFLHKSES